MVKDYLFKKPNRKPASQVSPHSDDKYNQQKFLFNPQTATQKSKEELCKDLVKTQTYTFTFEANSAKYNAQTVECNGTIQQIDSPVSYTLYKSIPTSPFKQVAQVGDTVNEHDIITIELDSVPTSQVKVEIVVSFQDYSQSFDLPEDLGGNYRYLYDLCRDDQAVHVIDTDTDTDIKTITLPTGFDFIIGCYRVVNKHVYIFDAGGEFVEIDADPSSANFNTIVNQDNIGFGSLMDCYYNYDKDVIYFNRRNNPFTTYNPSDGSTYENPTSNGRNRSASLYMHGLGLYCDNSNDIQFLDSNLDIIGFIFKESSRGIEYSYQSNLLINCQNGFFQIINIDKDAQGRRFQFIAQISTGTLRGGVGKDPNENKIIMGQFDGSGEYEVLDVSSLTTTRYSSGSITGSSRANNFAVYSEYSGKVYMQRTNNELVVFDLSKATPFEVVITTGNHESYRFTEQRHTIIANGLRL